MVRMKRGSRASWHLAGALLVSALGCNLVLGNEEGHLAAEGEGGDKADGGMGTSGGKAGSGGKRADGGAPSAGETGEAGSSAGGKGGSGGTTSEDAGSAGESQSEGGSTPARGGAKSSGGATNAGGKSNGGAPGVGGKANGGTGGSAVPPPMGGAQSCDPNVDPASCVNANNVRYCDDTTSTWATITCTDACTQVGFTTGTCPTSYCECSTPKNMPCDIGAKNYCECFGCTVGDYQGIYGACYQQIAPYDDITLCWYEATSCQEGTDFCGDYTDG